MKALTAAVLISGVLFAGSALARGAEDLAEEDFRSQPPPDYAQVQRLQEANKQAEMRLLAPAWGQPQTVAPQRRRRG